MFIFTPRAIDPESWHYIFDIATAAIHITDWLVQIHMLRAIIAIIMHDNALMIKILIQGDTNVRKSQ